MRSRKSILGTLAFFALLATVPLFVGSAYLLQVFILAMVYLVAVAGWDLIMGYGGVFSFAQIAFFVIGGYASGMVSLKLGLSPWLAMPLAGLITAIFGVLICLPCLRVRGSYVALITYALHLLLPTLIMRGQALGTGGSAGLYGVPALSIGSHVFNAMDMVPWFYIALGLAVIGIVSIYFVVIPSTYGLSLRALRDSDSFGKALGVNEAFTKITLFALSAFFTGLAGAFYVHFESAISQRLLGMDFFLLILVMLTLGGMARYPGVIIGTFTFAFINELFRVAASWRMVIVGSIIVVGTLVLPNGIVSLQDPLLARYRKWRGNTQPDPRAVQPEPDA